MNFRCRGTHIDVLSSDCTVKLAEMHEAPLSEWGVIIIDATELFHSRNEHAAVLALRERFPEHADFLEPRFRRR